MDSDDDAPVDISNTQVKENILENLVKLKPSKNKKKTKKVRGEGEKKESKAKDKAKNSKLSTAYIDSILNDEDFRDEEDHKKMIAKTMRYNRLHTNTVKVNLDDIGKGNNRMRDFKVNNNMKIINLKQKIIIDGKYNQIKTKVLCREGINRRPLV